jgi:hypothetical protein
MKLLFNKIPIGIFWIDCFTIYYVNSLILVYFLFFVSPIKFISIILSFYFQVSHILWRRRLCFYLALLASHTSAFVFLFSKG